MGPKVTVGENAKELKVLEIELYIEIKRSMKKMEHF